MSFYHVVGFYSNLISRVAKENFTFERHPCLGYHFNFKVILLTYLGPRIDLEAF